jgi:hypothetical protein
VSAIDAARAVLAWARRGQGAPPFTQPAALVHAPRLDTLVAPPPEVIAEASALAATRAARLRWAAPPLGDATSPGPGGVLLAGVVAFAPAPPFALALADACPPPTGAWDLVLRDAVASPALAARLEEGVADALRAHSPLTAAFGRPAPGGGDQAFSLLDRLRAHPDGRRAIVSVFSAPGAPRTVRRFREGVMDRLRTGDEAGRDLVLEIYEAALVHHRERTLGDAAAAFAALSGRSDGRVDLDDALAVAGWWGPLWAIRRAWPDALRKRQYLDVIGVIEGTRLFGLAQALTGGAV